MGISAFKLFLILGVVAILFLPTLIRRSSGLPALFDQLRARIAGEDPAGNKKRRRITDCDRSRYQTQPG
jgi:hypothetical protein